MSEQAQGVAMSALAPTLGVIRPYKRRTGIRHDVGDGRMLTVRQISKETGCDASAIYGRIRNGWTGKDLLRGRREKLFDVGGGNCMTIKQMMAHTGLNEGVIRGRLGRGDKGRALIRKGRERKDMAAPRSSTMVLACRIADAYPDRLPTTKEIRRLYPMTAQTAERWLTAMRAARGE